MEDASPYVRKTAVMSCVKLHLYSPKGDLSNAPDYIPGSPNYVCNDADDQARGRERTTSRAAGAKKEATTVARVKSAKPSAASSAVRAAEAAVVLT